MKRLTLSTHKALRVGALITAAAVFAAGFSGAAPARMEGEKPKSETVYAVLANDGSYAGATVVNRFFLDGEIVDYGTYTQVKNLTGADTPVVDGEKITWPAGLAGEDGFYYQGETQKALPVSFAIAYYLNGEKIQPEEISGRTGELKIEMTVRNNSGTGEMDDLTDREIMTPFAVQVSLSLASSMYTVREIPDTASTVLAGSDYTVAYSAFPLPESTFSFTLFGTNMTLEPISIIVLPKALPGLDSFGDVIDIDGLTDGADDLLAGADDMQSGADALLSGLKQMRSAAKDMQSGMNGLASGASSLENGMDSLNANVKALRSAADDFYAGMSAFAASFAAFDTGAGELQASVTEMTKKISDLKNLAAGVDAGVGGIGTVLGGLSTSNSTLASNAAALAGTDPAAAPIAAGLSAQQDVINALVSSASDLKDNSALLNTGMQQLYTGFSGVFTDSVNQLRGGSATLYASCLQLLDGAYKLQAACTALSGGAARLAGGADDIAAGMADAKAQLPKLLGALDELISGMAQLKGGISEMDEEGLRPLKDNIDGMEAYLDKLSQMAEKYTSFMDARNNAAVQFILKMQGF